MSNLILPLGYRSSPTAFHRPQPNPEMEARVRPWLKEMDSLLDIEWFENIHYVAKHNDYEGRYALVCKWPINDPRYALIQSGELGDKPFDILGWFTEDIQDGGTASVSPEFMQKKTLELLDSADNTKRPFLQRLKQMAEKNLERKRKLKEDFREHQTHDIASYYRNEALKIQQATVGVDLT